MATGVESEAPRCPVMGVPVQVLFAAFWSHASVCKQVYAPSDSNQELEQTWLTDLLTCGALFHTVVSESNYGP